MRDAAKHYRAVAAGKRSRAAGGFFEELIEDSCEYYSLMRKAEITKTPEPMKPIGPKNAKGQFLACYTKQAQPDYKGTLAGGRAVVFEAKYTDGFRMSRNVISQEQERQLERHEALGAECFVMVAFGFQRFFKVPWAIFRDMKEHYGRKYITPEDLQEYKVDYIDGVIHFL